MMRSRLIIEGGLTADPGGFALAIRLPWYRTLPLSVIDMPAVKIDGQSIDPSSVTLEVNGKRFDARSIRDAIDEWWYVLDRGTLHIAGHPLTAAPHSVTVEVNFAPPYIPEITLFCGATRTLVPGAI